MFEQGLILQIMNQKGPCLKEKLKILIGLMKDKLGGNIMKKNFGLSVKNYSYLIDEGSEDIKENLNLKITKTIQKLLNLKMK